MDITYTLLLCSLSLERERPHHLPISSIVGRRSGSSDDSNSEYDGGHFTDHSNPRQRLMQMRSLIFWRRQFHIMRWVIISLKRRFETISIWNWYAHFWSRRCISEERGSVGFTCNYCKRFSQPRVYQDVSQSFTMYRTLPMMAPLSFPSRGWCIIRVFTYTRRIYIIWARIECLSHCFSSIILIGHWHSYLKQHVGPLSRTRSVPSIPTPSLD